MQRGREKAVAKAIGYMNDVPSREREREKESCECYWCFFILKTLDRPDTTTQLNVTHIAEILQKYYSNITQTLLKHYSNITETVLK